MLLCLAAVKPSTHRPSDFLYSLSAGFAGASLLRQVSQIAFWPESSGQTPRGHRNSPAQVEMRFHELLYE
jgi:hypothetical protein